MKTFQQFQEDISKLPGLGGGGGGTNSITDKAPGRSLKKRVRDVGKVLTRPFHKKRVDPTEKFATEGVTSLAVKGGSKLIPALMTGIGAAGTIMQAKDAYLMQARKYKTRNNPEGKRKKRKLGPMEKSYHKKELGDRSNDMIVARRGEADKQNKLIDKYEKKFKSQQEKNFRKNVTKGLKGGEVIQDEFSAPTNNVGGGQIAGTVEAGDNPPVKKKKKTYAYGGRGSRKMWMNNK